MVIIIYIVFKGDRHLKECLNKADFDLRNLQTKLLWSFSRYIHGIVVQSFPWLTASPRRAFSIMFCPSGIKVVIPQHCFAKYTNNYIYLCFCDAGDIAIRILFFYRMVPTPFLPYLWRQIGRGLEHLI